MSARRNPEPPPSRLGVGPGTTTTNNNVTPHATSAAAMFGVEFEVPALPRQSTRTDVGPPVESPKGRPPADFVSVFGVEIERRLEFVSPAAPPPPSSSQTPEQQQSHVESDRLNAEAARDVDAYWRSEAAYERDVLSALAQAAVDPSVDDVGYEQEVLAVYGQHKLNAAAARDVNAHWRSEAAYERDVLSAHTQAAVDPSVDEVGYERDVLNAHRVRPSRSRDDVLRVTHCDLQDDIDFTRRSDPYWDEVAYERKVPAPINIITITSQIQTGWSPHYERSFGR
jgi:hypothetical protein